MNDQIPNRPGKYPCPNCAKGKGDKSLSVHLDAGELFYKCHRCDLKGKVEQSSLEPAPRYFDYRDESGAVLWKKVRIGDGSTKKIWQETPDFPRYLDFQVRGGSPTTW